MAAESSELQGKAVAFAHFSQIPKEVFSDGPYKLTGKYRGAHYLWLAPASFFSNAMGILSSGLTAIINFIAGSLFKIFALLCCCSKKRKAYWNKAAGDNFRSGVSAFTRNVPLMFVRMFAPNYDGFKKYSLGSHPIV